VVLGLRVTAADICDVAITMIPDVVAATVMTSAINPGRVQRRAGPRRSFKSRWYLDTRNSQCLMPSDAVVVFPIFVRQRMQTCGQLDPGGVVQPRPALSRQSDGSLVLFFEINLHRQVSFC